MKLLDTPQWEGLTTGQKRIIGTVYGEGDDGLVTALSPGARKEIEWLEELGLITVEWRERDVTIKLRAEGWSDG